MITISTAGDHEASPLGVMRAAAHRLPGTKQGRHLHARAANDSFALHEWALDDGDDVDDIETVKLANPASIQTVELLRQRHDSPSMLPWQWARFACGIWVGAESWWLKAETWQESVSEETLEPGDRITVGFDGSRYRDATALVGCRVEDGLLQPLQVWERPTDLPAYVGWEVPGGQVAGAVADAMERFHVERLYADPPLWQSELDEWVRLYGDVVSRYPTNRARFMAAVERFRTDLLAGAVPHTADEVLGRHVLNAQTREVRGGYWLEKPRTGTAGNIDAAVAAVLAYEARCDVVATGSSEADRGEFAFL
jgi:phage terminase large subunit-like protein